MAECRRPAAAARRCGSNDLMTVVGVRRGKAAFSSGCKTPPAIAPAGSNRSSYHALGFFPNKKLRENVARFRQINLDNPYEHHDALEFPSGQVVLLTRLCAGQRATVIQLPAGAQPPEGANEGEVAPEVRRVTFVE
jgi:hypothetical protein